MQIAAVLKSNAYGHGTVLVAKTLEPLQPPFFCVDSIFEAYELLNAGITTPILIMGFVDPENLKRKRLPFSYAVWNVEVLKKIHEYQPEAAFHIFVDTGMHREGIALDALPELLEEIKKIPDVKVEGLMSHLAAADKPEEPRTKAQIENFKKAIERVRGAGFDPKWIHIGATDGLLKAAALGTPGTMVRVGRGLYGVEVPEGKARPALTFTSTLVAVKNLAKDEAVGYDFSFVADGPKKIGILPVGYHDGLDRRLGNTGTVLVRGVACPIVGKISMNITTIDVTNVQGAVSGDEAVVISADPSAINSASAFAKLCGTISYEILIRLVPFTKRVLAE